MSEHSPHRVPRTDARTSIVEADSIHVRLRESTAYQHQRLDNGLRYVMGETLNRDRYANLLAALFGFYVPLEDYLSHWEAASRPLALPLIRRAGLLERDLVVLGRAPEQIPICTDMPILTTVDQVAGAIYVVEGACLGGQVIARAVMPRLDITSHSGGAFFNGEGVRTGARWRQVLAWLDERDHGTTVRDDIAAGACRTFAALSQWLMVREVLDE